MYTMTKGISNIFNNEVLNISKINKNKPVQTTVITTNANSN